MDYTKKDNKSREDDSILPSFQSLEQSVSSSPKPTMHQHHPVGPSDIPFGIPIWGHKPTTPVVPMPPPSSLYATPVPSNTPSSTHIPLPSSTSSPSTTLGTVSSPAKFQIANYNINPAPSLTLVPVSVQRTVRVALIQLQTGEAVEQGLKAGDLQAILPGVKSIEFSGLKLSRIGQLKKSLEPRGIKPKEVDYVLRFHIGSEYIDSSTFKIVSSYSQLPPEYQAQRPYKRQGTGSSSGKVPGKIQQPDKTEEDDPDAEEQPNKKKEKRT